MSERDTPSIQTTLEWEKFALRGKLMVDSKRGQTRLYREAVAILEREGVDLSAKDVRLVLAKAGVVRDELETLHWTDDKGRQKRTSWKQFDSSLSRHRKLIR